MRQPVVVAFSAKPSRLSATCDSLRALGFRVVPATTPAGVRAACRALNPRVVLVGRSVADLACQAVDAAHEFGAKVVVLHEGSGDPTLPADYSIRLQPGSYRLFCTLLELCG